MRLLLAALIVAVPMVAQAIPLNLPTDQNRCEKATDCTAVPGVCGGWVAVNQQSVEATLAAVKDAQATVQCQLIMNTKFPKLACQHQTCVGVHE